MNMKRALKIVSVLGGTDKQDRILERVMKLEDDAIRFIPMAQQLYDYREDINQPRERFHQDFDELTLGSQNGIRQETIIAQKFNMYINNNSQYAALIRWTPIYIGYRDRGFMPVQLTGQEAGGTGDTDDRRSLHGLQFNSNTSRFIRRINETIIGPKQTLIIKRKLRYPIMWHERPFTRGMLLENATKFDQAASRSDNDPTLTIHYYIRFTAHARSNMVSERLQDLESDLDGDSG